MKSYGDALNTVLEHIAPMNAEEKPLLACAGQVTSEDIRSEIDLPSSDIAGPDGYALRSADLKEAGKDSPATLRVIGTARAGCVSRTVVKPGCAIRIMTGSVIPKGADCVVRFEDTDEPKDKNGPNRENPKEVGIYVAAEPGANIRPIGSTVREGTLVVPKGTIIGPVQISALASIGKTRIKVIRRPVIAVITTGDELVNPGRPLPPGKVYNCNSAAIAAVVTHYGGIPVVLGVARDKEAEVAAKIRKGLNADAIITSGGVSKGDYDLVRLVLGEIGHVIFSRINMGPGAAVAFGQIEKSSENGGNLSVPVFALSGPPTGCLINLETLVRPALLKMRGVVSIDHPEIEAIAINEIPRKMAMSFVRWTHVTQVEGEYRVELNRSEKDGMLASMATANSLTITPEGTTITAGDRIRVLPLDWHGDQLHP
jgi:molybdopterin molybdotransferase